MTSDQLLEKALYSSASIHQPHSLKAYLAANHLNGYFAKSDNVWLKTSDLIDQTEIEVLGEYSASAEVYGSPTQRRTFAFCFSEFICNNK